MATGCRSTTHSVELYAFRTQHRSTENAEKDVNGQNECQNDNDFLIVFLSDLLTIILITCCCFRDIVAVYIFASLRGNIGLIC